MNLHYFFALLFSCCTILSFSQAGHKPAAGNDKQPNLNFKSLLTEFPNEGWSERTNLNAPRWAAAPVFVPVCSSTTDDGDIYLIGGANNSFGYISVNSAFNLATNSWTTKAPLPAARGQVTPVYLNGKIYVIGGYVQGFDASDVTFIYDVNANSWTQGATMPQAVGDYACGVYNGLIYVVGGSYNSNFFNTVQVYDPAADNWILATDKPGTAVGGGRMGIRGNKIVTAGGYDPQINGPVAEVHLGVIDPSDPGSITWTALEDYPAGALSRLAAGVAPQDSERVYFAGGDPFSNGQLGTDLCFAYNLTSGIWEDGPNMIHGVNNILSLAGFVHNGKQYLATMGGLADLAVTSWHEWLDLGPAEADNNTLLASTDDAEVTNCNGTLQAAASGGTPPYSWLWNDPAMQATATATALCAGTYSVQVTDAGGCTATATAVLSEVTGISDANAARKMSIYPNPTNGWFTMKHTSSGNISRLLIADLTNRQMMELSLGTLRTGELTEVDISALPAGIYNVQLYDGETRVGSQKVVKY